MSNSLTKNFLQAMSRPKAVKLILGHAFSEICTQRQIFCCKHSGWFRQFHFNKSSSSSLTLAPSLAAKRMRSSQPESIFYQSAQEGSDVRAVDLKRHWLYFDTHALVKKLQATGFTLEQCEAITQALVETVNVQLEHQDKVLVTKAQQEITVQQLLANIATVRKDMLILEKSEFSALRNETEKQTMEINRTKQMLADEISKLKGQITLDINLEKSRAKEAHADGERERSQVNNRIDMEVANLRTIYEQYRNDIIKYAGGTVLSCLTICLGFYRLWT